MTDPQLLRQYVHSRSEQAFAELVNRHVDWIFSTARRLVRDPTLAQDVTQAVFIVLARKAPSLLSHPALSPWLFKVTRYTASRVLQSERRRQHHEQRAASMNPHAQTPPHDDPEPHWQTLAPVLDDLVSRLGKEDRRALLLRFYERMSFASVGGALAVSEDAARKRVSRAVEKLRILFAAKGITVTAAGLSSSLWANTTQAAGAAVASAAAQAAASSAASAAAAGGATPTALSLANGVLAMSTAAKIAIPTAAAIAILTVAGVVARPWLRENAIALAPINAPTTTTVSQPTTAATAPATLASRSSSPPPAPAPQPERLGQWTFAELLVQEGQAFALSFVNQEQGHRISRQIVQVKDGVLDIPEVGRFPTAGITQAALQMRIFKAYNEAKLVPQGAYLSISAIEPAHQWVSRAVRGLARIRLPRPPHPIPVVQPAQKILPLVSARTIRKRDPDMAYDGVISGRTWENFGFMRFDLSNLKQPPKKATFHGACFLIENTKGQRTPARLVFYLIKTDWDQSATFNYANSKTQTPWPTEKFDPLSRHNLDQKEVAIIEVPNPPPPGYNVEFDITNVVADWVTGHHPNYGLMLRVEQEIGYSYQANLCSFDFRSHMLPYILCVMDQ